MKQKSKEQQDSGPLSDHDLDDFGFGDIAKSMQAFVQKMSSYKGAEVPKNRLVSFSTLPMLTISSLCMRRRI